MVLVSTNGVVKQVIVLKFADCITQGELPMETVMLESDVEFPLKYCPLMVRRDPPAEEP